MEKINDLVTHQNVRFTYSSACKISDNANRITGSAKSGTKVFVRQDYCDPIGMNRTKNYKHESHTFLWHYK